MFLSESFWGNRKCIFLFQSCQKSLHTKRHWDRLIIHYTANAHKVVLNKVWESVFKKALVALFNRINAKGVLVFTNVFGQPQNKGCVGLDSLDLLFDSEPKTNLCACFFQALYSCPFNSVSHHHVNIYKYFFLFLSNKTLFLIKASLFPQNCRSA